MSENEKVWVEATCVKANHHLVELGGIVVGRVTKERLKNIQIDSRWKISPLESVPPWYAALELANVPLIFTKIDDIDERWRKKP